MKHQDPQGRGQTIRQRMTALLEGEDMSARELSQAMGIREREVYDHLSHIARSVAAVRKQLDETAFAAAWAKGRAMSLEQAVSYALEVGQPEPAAPAPDLSPDPGPAEPSS